jgi:hypothetical protein
MFRCLSVALVALSLSGCIRTGSQQVTATGEQESLRTAIARLALKTPEFGSVSIIKAKIINARISAPHHRRSPFTGEEYTYYCIQAAIENPMFPLHQPAYADVEVNAQQRIEVTSRRSACLGAQFEPFPEIEAMSVARYNT